MNLVKLSLLGLKQQMEFFGVKISSIMMTVEKNLVLCNRNKMGEIIKYVCCSPYSIDRDRKVRLTPKLQTEFTEMIRKSYFFLH